VSADFAKRADSCSANNIQCMNDMLKSDTTVPATGYHTECGLEDALDELGVDYDVAGNAVKPRKLINATNEAYLAVGHM